MTPEERTAVWHEAADWGFNRAFVELFNQTDKRAVLMSLFRKTHEMANCDMRHKKEWEAYSEGFRHAINIIDNLGPALEAYNNITNPSIQITLTEEDVKRLR